MSVGLLIREARKRAGLTQEQLAVASGITRGHVIALENGRYNPTVKTLSAIAEACGATLEVFFLSSNVGNTDISEE